MVKPFACMFIFAFNLSDGHNCRVCGSTGKAGKDQNKKGKQGAGVFGAHGSLFCVEDKNNDVVYRNCMEKEGRKG